MKFTPIKNIIILVVLIFFQSTFIKYFALSSYNIIPDFVLIMIAIIGIREGKISGSLYGFLSGLILDILSGTFLGLLALSYSIAGFISGFYRTENGKYLNKYYFLFVIFLTSIICNTIYFSIFFQGTGDKFLSLTSLFILTSSSYTLFMSMIYLIFPRKKEIEGI